MNQPLTLNPLFQLWKKLSFNALFCAHFSECLKVVELAMVQIMGSMEDEKTFFTLTFMKTRL